MFCVLNITAGALHDQKYWSGKNLGRGGGGGSWGGGGRTESTATKDDTRVTHCHSCAVYTCLELTSSLTLMSTMYSFSPNLFDVQDVEEVPLVEFLCTLYLLTCQVELS